MRPREWTRTRSLKRDPDFTLIVKFGGEVNRNGTNPFQKKFIFTQRFNEVTINTCHDLNIQETLLGKEDDGSINNKKKKTNPAVCGERDKAGARICSARVKSRLDPADVISATRMAHWQPSTWESSQARMRGRKWSRRRRRRHRVNGALKGRPGAHVGHL